MNIFLPILGVMILTTIVVLYMTMRQKRTKPKSSSVSRQKTPPATPSGGPDDDLVLENIATSIPRGTQRLRPAIVDRSAEQLSGKFSTIGRRFGRVRRIRPTSRPKQARQKLPMFSTEKARRQGLRSQVYTISEDQLYSDPYFTDTLEMPTEAISTRLELEESGFDLPQNLNEFGATSSPGIAANRSYTSSRRFGRITFETTGGREFVERGDDIENTFGLPTAIDYEKYLDKPSQREMDFDLEYNDYPYTSFFTGFPGSGMPPFTGKLISRTDSGRDFTLNGGTNGNGHHSSENGNGVHVVGIPAMMETTTEAGWKALFDLYTGQAEEVETPVEEPRERLVTEPLFTYGNTGLLGYLALSREARRKRRRDLGRNPFAPFREMLNRRNRIQVVLVGLSSLFVVFFIVFGLAFLSRQIDRAPLNSFSLVMGRLGEGNTFKATERGREISVGLSDGLVANMAVKPDIRRTELVVSNQQEALQEQQRTKADITVWGYYDTNQQLYLNLYLNSNGPFEPGEGARKEIELHFFEPELLQIISPVDSDIFLRVVTGLNAYYSGDYNLATTIFTSVSRSLDKNDAPEIHVLNGNAFYLYRKYDAALREYDLAIKLANDLRAQGRTVTLDLEQVQNNRSIVLAHSARIKDPNPVALNKDPGYNEAVKTLQTLATNRLEQPRYMANYIDLMIESGDASNNTEQLIAISSRLKTAMDSNKDFWPGHYYLGQTYRILNDWENSEKYFKNAQSLRPDFVPGYYGLGSTYLDKYFLYYAGRTNPDGDKILKDARTQFDRAQTLATQQREIFSTRANAYRATLGKEDLAPYMEDLARNSLQEGNEAKFGLARDMLERGRTEGNRIGNFMDQFLRWAKGEKTALEDARDRFTQIVDERKDFGPGYFYLGEAYYLLGDVTSANKNYEIAKTKPQPSVLYYSTIADHLVRDNKNQEALNEINKYIKAYPNAPDGYEAQSELYLRIKDPANALKSANEAIKRNPLNAQPWLVQGRALSAMGRYSEAATSFNKASEIDSTNPEIAFEQGSTLYAARNGDEALKALQRAIDLKGGSGIPNAHYLMGRIYQEIKENTPFAIREYSLAVGEDDSLSEAWFQLGQIYSQLNRLNEAIDAYGKVLQYNPQNYNAAYAQGLLLEAVKRPADAEKAYRQAISINSGLLSGYIQLSRLLSQKNDTGAQDEAITLARDAIKLDARNPQAQDILAYALFQRGNYTESINAYNATLATNPNFVDGYYNRATAYYNLRQYDKALPDINQALKLKDTEPAYYLLQGQILQVLGNADAAVAAYGKAIEFKLANPAPAYLGIGDIYLSRGQVGVAQNNYLKATAADPENLTAYNQLASTYFIQGNLDKAVVEFEKVIKRQPTNGLAWYYLGVLYARQARPDDALTAFQNAVNFEPNRIEAHFELGNAYRVKGLRKQALDEYDNALKLNKNNYAVYLQKGLTLEDNGDLKQARENLQEALKSPDPNIQTRAREALGRIGG